MDSFKNNMEVGLVKRIIILVAFLTLFSGCVNSERIYISGMDKIILFSDHTFIWYEYHNNPATIWSGEYKENIDTVLFIFKPPFPSYEMQKSGNNLTLICGRGTYTWVRQ